jgi:excisionase family DNA binding protein
MPIQSNKKMQVDPNEAAPELVSVEAAAVKLGLSPWTLRRWICDRKITSCRLGTRRLIPSSEIARIISEGTVEREAQVPVRAKA